MKKVSLLTLALMATAPMAVSAAEVVVPAGAPCAPTPCPCPKAFQGFYFGGNLGYGIGAVRAQDFFNLGGGTGQLSKTKIAAQGIDGGVLIGYTHRFGNVGVGLDVYFNWMNTAGRLTTAQIPSANLSNTYHNVYMKNNLEVRVPFSYVICNLVAPKVILGWTNANWTNQLGLGTGTVPNANGAYKNNSRYNGFLWGFGVDFLLAKHVISGLEYTGAVYGNTNFRDTLQDTSSCRPVYNKFAATLKFIY